ncbi:uncharacterized protein [Nicotiana tomentosiformis]|uniref:uncharacterized protein n=1 Tax=Nicotiana tomentosiformis TaxID=4098 RepID=UPI00388C501F
MGSFAFISVEERPLTLDIQSLTNKLERLDISEPSRVLACVVAQSSLFERIKARQYNDPQLLVLRGMVLCGGAKVVAISDNGVLRLHGHLCVPNVDGLRETILDEAHSSRYFIYPGDMKMYSDLRQHYWLRLMKDIVECVTRCLNYQQVKYEHQRPGGLLQQVVIPEWEWKHIIMDLVVGLPRKLRKFDAIWVIIGRLTKSEHFIPIVTMYSLERLAKIYIQEIV